VLYGRLVLMANKHYISSERLLCIHHTKLLQRIFSLSHWSIVKGREKGEMKWRKEQERGRRCEREGKGRVG